MQCPVERPVVRRAKAFSVVQAAVVAVAAPKVVAVLRAAADHRVEAERRAALQVVERPAAVAPRAACPTRVAVPLAVVRGVIPLPVVEAAARAAQDLQAAAARAAE